MLAEMNQRISPDVFGQIVTDSATSGQLKSMGAGSPVYSGCLKR